MSTDKAMVTDAANPITPQMILDTAAWSQSEDDLRDTLRMAAEALSAALAQAEQPVAYSFRLATAIQHHEDGSKEYCNFDKEPRLSLMPPCVPVGSIKDYIPLYAHPPAKREAGEAPAPESHVVGEDATKAAFNHGYVLACCNIANLHDEPGIAFDVLRELGISKPEVKAMELCDYDAKALREIERARGSSSLYVEAKAPPPQSREATPQSALAWVADYAKSDGTTDYYVMIGEGERAMSVHMHRIRGRAEYEAAEINHALTGSPKPEFEDFDLDAPAPTPQSDALPSPQQREEIR